MAEYIDREALIQQMADNFRQGVWDGCDCGEYQIAETTILCAPAADVVEVKHGRWIPAAAYNDGKINTVYCSECKCYQPVGEWDYYDFCMFCGAKMEAE